MLRISYPPMRVFVNSVRMQPKVAPVLALMAVRAKQYPPEHAWVSAAEVALLPDWRSSKSKSVGTEVYNAFRRLGLQQSGLVLSPHLGKVTKWRFDTSIEVHWQPNFDSVAKALNAITPPRAADLEINPDLPNRITDATRSKAVSAGAISEIATKIKGANSAALNQLLESNPHWDCLLRPDAQTQFNRAQVLARQASMMLQSGDSSTAATLFGAAGSLANAEHAYESGKRWLLTAIPLLLAHGALIELEAALVNLSISCAQLNASDFPTSALAKA